MKNSALVTLLTAILILLPAFELHARGRGGGGFSRGGGGGRFSRGGGGGMSRGGGLSRGGGGIRRPPVSRPSHPSFSRPSRPNISARPSVGNRPSFPSAGNRPNIGAGNRPNIGTGNRANAGKGNFPGIGIGNRAEIGGSNRPSIRPRVTTPGGSQRPNLPGAGNRPGIGQRPNRPGTGNRPGISGRPSQRPSLPGFGAGVGIGAGIANRPGVGNRPGIGERTRIGNRPNVGNRPGLSERRNQIQSRLANRPTQLPVRDRWQESHNRWNQWHNNHYYYHGGWYHGFRPAYWNPGSYWGYWWNNYPALSAFGLTTWAINRLGWAFGYNNYYNPYAYGTTYVNNVYNYSQPLVMTPGQTTLAGNPNSTASPPNVSPEALAAFDQARQQFYAGNYQAALTSTDAALKQAPNDAAIHEFRALTLFALGKYQDAAAVLYAVLGVGPGWDWTTMSGLYPDVATYTQQLRALEAYRDQNPNDPAARFVLAYHYMTQGHNEAAVTQLQKLLNISPKDQLAKQLLMNLDPNAQVPNPPKQVEPPKPRSDVTEAQLQGSWAATRGDGSFGMDLKDDGTYSWKYTTGGKTQEVTGVWNVDDKGILALEMNDESTMLAQVIPHDNKLDFYMLGDTQGEEPLKFAKQ